jgi:hypothetical protein
LTAFLFLTAAPVTAASAANAAASALAATAAAAALKLVFGDRESRERLKLKTPVKRHERSENVIKLFFR